MATRSYKFPSSLRLSGKPRFDAVYAARVRQSRGPLAMFSLPNGLGHVRLGISISRKVGIAVQRNHIKRLLRESMRLLRHDIPAGYDVVVVVRPHEALIFTKYQELMQALMAKSHQAWIDRPASPPPAKA